MSPLRMYRGNALSNHSFCKPEKYLGSDLTLCKDNKCNGRVYRIGSSRKIMGHVLLAAGASFEMNGVTG
jgi:hypothetical protein